MPNEIDERIVEAKFDSSDFEKGVDRTVKKLDELKDSLNLKDVNKSVTNIANETKKATERASESLDKLSERFTTFAGMIKQKFISGIADQITGVFFKIEHGIMGLVSQLSSQQVSVGLSKYEQMLTSIRVMTTAKVPLEQAYESISNIGLYADETSYSLDQMTDAMSKMVAAGVEATTAEKAVQGIANACAVAGVNATDAQRAFFNLSQAYSSGFLKYTDYRSLQLLNMTNENFENELLEAGVRAGTLKKVKDGTYKTQKSKKNKKVVAGKTITRKNITQGLQYNFADTDVMNELFGKAFYMDASDYRNNLDAFQELGMSWDDAKKKAEELGKTIEDVDDAKKALGLDEDSKFMDQEKARAKTIELLNEKYGEFAVKAFMAAREARSFTDVFNTLKDVISRGWSKTFEILIGNLEQATEFFTWLTENQLANAIYSIGEWRNAMLEAWGSDGEGMNSSGRQMFIEGLHNLDDVIGTVHEHIQTLIPDAETTGQSFNTATIHFRDFTEKFKTWFTVATDDKGRTRVEKLANALGIISKAIGIVGQAIGVAFRLSMPLLAGFFTIIDELLGPLSDLGSTSTVFDNLSDSLKNAETVLTPVVNVLSQFLGIVGKVASFFLSMAIDTAIANISFFSDAFGLFMEVIFGKSAQQDAGRGVLDGIKQSITEFGDACKSAGQAVKDFFDALLKDLKQILGLDEEVDGEEKGGFFKNVQNFFDTNEFLKSAESWLNQASIDVDNWIKSIPTRVGNLANKIYDAIFGVFYEKEDVKVYNNGKLKNTVTVYKETEFKKQLDEWFESIKKTVTEFIDSIPKRIQDFFNSIPGVFDQIFGALFGTGEETSSSKSDSSKKGGKTGDDVEKTAEEEIKPTLESWFAGVKKAILDFIASIPTRIGNLGSSIYNIIFGIFYEKQEVRDYDENGKMHKATIYVKTEFTKWIDGIFDSVKEFILSIPKRVQDFFNSIPSVFDQFMGALTGSDKETSSSKSDSSKKGGRTGDPKEAAEEEIKPTLDAWLAGAVQTVLDFIKSIPEKIGDLANSLYETVFGIFYEKRERVKNVKANGEVEKETYYVDSAFKKWVDGIRASIEKRTKKLKNMSLRDIFNRIFFKTEKDKNGKDVQKKTGFALLLDNIFGEDQMDQARTKIGEFIDKVQIFLDNARTTIDNVWNKLIGEGEYDNIFDRIKAIFSDIGNFIISIFSGSIDADVNSEWLAQKVASAINYIKTKASEVWEKVKEFFVSIPNKIVGIFTGTDPEPDQKDPDTIGGAIESFGKTIGGFIADLPQTITEFFTSAIENIGKLWDWLYSALSGEATEKDKPEITKPGQVKSATEVVEDAVEAYTDTATGDSKIQSKWDTFVKSLGEMISSAFEKLPTWVAQGIDLALKGFNWAVEGISNWFKDNDITEAVEKSIGDGTDLGETVAESIAGDETEKTEGNSALVAAMVNIGKTIWKIITETIPKFVTNAFDWLKKQAKEWWHKLGEVFDEMAKDGGEEGSDSKSPKQRIGQIGKEIYNWITGIAKDIRKGIASLRNGTWWNELGETFKDWADKGGALGFIGDAGLFIKKAIEDLIPKFESAIQTVKKWFTGEGEEEAKSVVKAPMIPLGEELLKTLGLPKDGKLNIDEKKLPSADDFAKVLPGQKLQEAIDADKNKTKAGGSLFDNVADAISTFMKKLGEYTKKAFELLTPYILDGVSATIDFFGKVITTAGDVLTGKKTLEDVAKEIFGDEAFERFKEPINKFKTSVENFGTNVSTSLFGEGSFLGDLFGGLFGGDDKDKKETDKTVKDGQKRVEKVTSGAKEMAEQCGEVLHDITSGGGGSHGFGTEEETTVFDGINTILGKMVELGQTFAGSSLGTLGLVVAGIAMIAVVIKQLADALTLGDEIENTAWGAKWVAIGAAVVAISYVMSKVLDLAADTSDSQKMKNLQSVLDFFNTIGAILAIIFGEKMVKGFTDWRTAKAESKAVQMEKGAKTAEKVGSGFVNILTDLGKTLGTDLKVILGIGTADIASGMVTDMIGKLSELAIKLAQDMETLASSALRAFEDLRKLHESYQKGGVKEAIGDVLEVVKEAARLLNPNEYVVEGVNGGEDYIPPTLDTILTAITNVTGAIQLLKEAFTIKEGSLKTDEIIKSFKDLMNLQSKMTEFAEFSRTTDFKDFKYAISALGVAMSMFDTSAFGKLDPENSNWVADSVKFLKQVFGSEEVKGLSEELAKNELPDQRDSLDAAEKLGILAAALSMIGTASAGLSETTGEQISTLFATISQITVPEGTTISDLSLQMGTLGGALSSFATNTSGVTEDTIKNAAAVIGLFTSLSGALDHLAKGFFEKILSGEGDFTKFADGIETIGQKMRLFFESIDYDEDGNAVTHNKENIEMVGNFIRDIGLSLSHMNFKYISGGETTSTFLKAITENVVGLGQSIRTLIDETNNSGITPNDDTLKTINLMADIATSIGGALATAYAAFKKAYSDSTGYMKTNMISQIGTYMSIFTDHVITGVIDEIIKLRNTLLQKQVSTADFERTMSGVSSIIAMIVNLMQNYYDFVIDRGSGEQSKKFFKNIRDMFSNLYYYNQTIKNTIATFSDTDVDGLNKISAIISDLNTIILAFKSGFDAGILNNFDFDFPRQLQKVIDALIGLDFNSFDVIADEVSAHEENITKTGELVGMLSDVAKMIYYFSEIGQIRSTGNFMNMRNAVSEFANGFATIDWSPLANLSTTVISSMFSSEEGAYDEIGATVAKQFIASIQKAIDESEDDSMKLKITPVLSTEGIQEQLKTPFEANLGPDSTLTVKLPEDLDYTQFGKDYSIILSEISTKVQTMSDSIDTLGDDMAKMKLYLDGDKLVGGIMPRIRKQDIDDMRNYDRGIIPVSE